MRDDVAAQFMSRIEENQLKVGKFLTGCDWSHWQASKLDADMSDYDFFIHKISEGKNFIDDKANYRVTQLHTNKPCILYHFFNAKVDGKTQAQHFMETMTTYFGGCRVGFAVDFEIEETDRQLNELQLFMSEMYKYGHTPIIYCGDFSKARVIAATNNAPLWIARWRKRKPNTLCKFWQFTNKPYDLDLFFGEMSELSLLLEWV